MTNLLRLWALETEISDLEADIQWGRDHPYAGVCGEDDAKADKLEQLKKELEELKKETS